MYGYNEEKNLLRGSLLWIREERLRCDRNERQFLLWICLFFHLIVFIEGFLPPTTTPNPPPPLSFLPEFLYARNGDVEGVTGHVPSPEPM